MYVHNLTRIIKQQILKPVNTHTAFDDILVVVRKDSIGGIELANEGMGGKGVC